MSHPLHIPQQGALDLVSLGALIHRLDPGTIPFRKATQCQIHVSGGEFNVAANLADCFRLNTGIATAMVDYPIGDMIAERVRAMGVRPFYKHFAHDGVTGPNMATVYSDRGHGMRAPVVFYNRSNEAACLLKPGDFDWKAIFQGGVRWFHSGGIFAALSPTTAEIVIEGMEAAKAAGAVVSFDLNYREKLWKISGGAARASEVLGRIVKKPMGALVGDIQRQQIPFYIASGRRDTTPEQEIEYLKTLVSQSGAKALKFRVGGRMRRNADAMPGRTETLIPLVRKTFGDAMVIMADSNSSYDPPKAIEVGRLLESIKAVHYEEPCPFDHLADTKLVADTLDIPVALGEQEYSDRRFRWTIANRAADIIQPDLFYYGGMVRAIWVARMANLAKLPITAPRAQSSMTSSMRWRFRTPRRPRASAKKLSKARGDISGYSGPFSGK